MVLVKKISDTEAIIENCKKIKVDELTKLGYKLSKRQLPLGNRPYKYGIIEVKNEDRDDPVSFSYLYSTLEEEGIILPYGFDYYLSHPFGA